MEDQPISLLPVKDTPEDTDFVLIYDPNNPDEGMRIALSAFREALEGTPGVTYSWQGTWVTATAYAVNDCVNHDGSGYVCLVAHTSGTFTTDFGNGDWSLFVQKGDQGIQGETGDTGPASLTADILYGTDTEAPDGQADGAIYVTYIP